MPRFNGYLSDKDIYEHRVDLFPNDFDQIHPKGASVDLRLGTDCHLSSERQPQRLSTNKPDLVIPSGDFAVLMTKEMVHIPKDVIGFITMRFTYKAKGLINVSGFHVDPGYKGHLIYAVYNAGPRDILVSYGKPLFTIFFAGLNQEAKHGRQPGHTGLPESVISNLSSGAAPTNIPSLAKRVEKLELRFSVAVAALVTVAVPLIVLAADFLLRG